MGPTQHEPPHIKSLESHSSSTYAPLRSKTGQVSTTLALPVLCLSLKTPRSKPSQEATHKVTRADSVAKACGRFLALLSPFLNLCSIWLCLPSSNPLWTSGTPRSLVFLLLLLTLSWPPPLASFPPISSTPGVLNLGELPLGDICLETVLVVTPGEVLWHLVEAKDAAKQPQCPGQPPTQNHLVPNVNRAEGRALP